MRYVLFCSGDVTARQQSRRRSLGGQPKKLSSCCHLRCSTPFTGKGWEYLRLFTTVQQVSALRSAVPPNYVINSAQLRMAIFFVNMNSCVWIGSHSGAVRLILQAVQMTQVRRPLLTAQSCHS